MKRLAATLVCIAMLALAYPLAGLAEDEDATPPNACGFCQYDRVPPPENATLGNFEGQLEG